MSYVWLVAIAEMGPVPHCSNLLTFAPICIHADSRAFEKMHGPLQALKISKTFKSVRLETLFNILLTVNIVRDLE